MVALLAQVGRIELLLYALAGVRPKVASETSEISAAKRIRNDFDFIERE